MVVMKRVIAAPVDQPDVRVGQPPPVVLGGRTVFPSRRRHTRRLSDWSSDVCSSDLVTDAAIACPDGNDAPLVATSDPGGLRSEERRVGKECRYRWARRWR